MALSRRSRRWLVVLGVIALLLGALKLSRNWLAAKALHQLTPLAEKGGYVVTFGAVDFSLFRQHLRIADFSMIPKEGGPATDSSARFTIKAGEIDLQGVDAWALIQDHVLRVGHVRLRDPELEHSFITRTKKTGGKAQEKAEPPAKDGFELIHVDTLLIENARGSSRDRTQENPSLSVDGLDLMLTGIGVEDDDNGAPRVSLEHAKLELRGARAQLKPYYSLTIDSLRAAVPENSAMIFGLRLTPDVNEQEYHEQVKFQVELYEAAVDTIMLTGFDLTAKLEGGALLAERLYLAGVAVDIHRDKSIPMVPDPPRKALLAEKMQGWTTRVALDSIAFQRCTVTYHERLKRGEDYGSLTFTNAAGSLTGMDNMAPDGSTDLHLAGTASVWDKARARLDLHMSKGTDPTTVQIEVGLEDLPATELNRMTDELVHVNATDGHIHRVTMQMTGDDRNANATVDVRYEDLHLELSPAIQHAAVLSFLANQIVRSSNMPGEKGYRLGHSRVTRRQNAGVFNYLWIALREGMMDVMLPPAVLKQMRKQKGG